MIHLDYYDVGYFDVCGYYGNYEVVDIDKITGTADNWSLPQKNWLSAIIKPRPFYESYRIAQDNIEYYFKGADIDNTDAIELVERNGEYYVVDGNHRINVFKLLTEANYLGCSTKVKIFTRHLPHDKFFSDYFVQVVERYNLFDSEIDHYDGYQSITPHFEYLDNNYAHPTIRHKTSGMIIKSIEDVQTLENMYKERFSEK